MSERTLSPDELAAIRRRLAALGKGEMELVDAALGPDVALISLEGVRDTEVRYLVSVLDRWERKARNGRRARAIP